VTLHPKTGELIGRALGKRVPGYGRLHYGVMVVWDDTVKHSPKHRPPRAPKWKARTMLPVDWDPNR
jgi:hypothetical protein